MKPDELAGLIHPDDLAMVAKVFTRDWEKCSGTTIVFRIRHQEGHWISIESRYNPILDETGKLDSVMIVSRDVSEVMHTKELLRQTDKLSAIGQLAAGIAHEIRNPLTSLRGFVQLLQASLAEPRYCEIMLAELDRINFIVSELLVLAKPQQMKFQEKIPTQIIYDVISLLESQANMNNVIFHDHLERSLPTISCDENQLKQVFINVCKNAIEALPQGGDIYVESTRLAPSRIRISIRDTGKGIDPSRIPRLGEPFYTTKENGTGLGLMVSYRILEEHGGSLTIESEPEKGTTDCCDEDAPMKKGKQAEQPVTLGDQLQHDQLEGRCRSMNIVPVRQQYRMSGDEKEKGQQGADANPESNGLWGMNDPVQVHLITEIGDRNMGLFQEDQSEQQKPRSEGDRHPGNQP
uniref:Sensory histidine protein kinase n=1 Tax=Physcomitrium patens TaxID=3218 RepID=A9U6N3_PHYPA